MRSDRCTIVGRGRVGHALAAALRRAGWTVDGPLGRDATPSATDGDVVVLAVPDGEIAAAAAAVPPGPLVGHCSGATGLEPLAPHEGFSLAPVMTIAGEASHADLPGATCLVDGATPRALAAAEALAAAAGMRAAHVPAEDRPAYHAAAALASNYLLALEDAAERLAATAGLDRAALAPLVRATVANWAEHGAAAALTGPLARGDEATVERQRAAVADRAPGLLELWDALTAATRDLAQVPA